MAYEENITPLSFVANADLSASPNRFVKIVNSSGVGKIDLAGVDDAVIGVLLDTPKAGEVGRVAALQGGGKCGIYLNGTVTAGDQISAGASGVGVAQSSTHDTLGIILASGVAGEIHTLLLNYIDK